MYDIPLLKPLTGMTILAPTCAEDMSEAIQIALSSSSPVAIRYPRGNVPAKDEIAQNQKSTEEARSKVQILAVGDQVIKAIKFGLSSRYVLIGTIWDEIEVSSNSLFPSCCACPPCWVFKRISSR